MSQEVKIGLVIEEESWHGNITEFATSNMSHQIALRFFPVGLPSLVPFS